MGGWDASETASRREGKPKQKFNEKATVVVALYERKLSIPPIRYAFYLFSLFCLTLLAFCFFPYIQLFSFSYFLTFPLCKYFIYLDFRFIQFSFCTILPSRFDLIFSLIFARFNNIKKFKNPEIQNSKKFHHNSKISNFI